MEKLIFLSIEMLVIVETIQNTTENHKVLSFIARAANISAYISER